VAALREYTRYYRWPIGRETRQIGAFISARAHTHTRIQLRTHACTYASARRCCSPADRYADRIACPEYADDQATPETGRDSAEKDDLRFSAGKNASIAGFPRCPRCSRCGLPSRDASALRRAKEDLV